MKKIQRGIEREIHQTAFQKRLVINAIQQINIREIIIISRAT